MKKLMWGVAAVVLPVGILASSAGVAAAKKPMPVNVTNASVTCTKVTGSDKWAPRVSTTGSNPANSNIKLVLSGCTVSGVAGVTITSGKGAGVLHYASNNASNLTGTSTVSGHINIKWSSSPKLTFKESSMSVTATTGAVSGNYAALSIAAGGASVSGDFQGNDNGASSTFYAESTQTISTLGTEATPPSKGIKIINFGTDGTHLQPNSITLG
jgi:hypothetical protein